MTISLRTTIAITAAYAVALHGLLALSVIAAHFAGATDRAAFALCANAGSGDGDHQGVPGQDPARCLQLCLAVGNAAACDPHGRGQLTSPPSTDAPLSISAAAETLPPAAPASAANRSRAPPA